MSHDYRVTPPLALAINSASLSVTDVDWTGIDTVLLDMDGTLLDLQFDNQFWLETIPAEVARRRGIDLHAARQYLNPIFEREAGQLNWYCLDFWSKSLGFSVAELKTAHAHGVAWRPYAQQFLTLLKNSHCQVFLVTNAHPETLRVKLERINLTPWLDRVVSSHEYGEPKESQVFWTTLQQTHPFDPEKTLFIDDSEAVLASAEQFGIRHLITLRQPDSTQPPKAVTRYPAIIHFDEIYAGLIRDG